MFALLIALVWALLLLLGVGAAVWFVLRVYKRREQAGPAMKTAAALVALCLVSAFAGTLYGFMHAFGAVDGEHVDPSQKARMLAEGISEAMNCTAFAAIILIPAVIVLALLMRRRKRRGAFRRTNDAADGAGGD
jgi:hypothetical protein